MSGDTSWTLDGEAIVTLVSRNRRMTPLPAGIHRLPGPALVVAQNFRQSPFGSFRTVSFGEPARLGARPGFFFGVCVVDNSDVRRMSRKHWGFVQELGRVTWTSDATSRSCVWEERGIQVSAELGHFRFPLMLPGRAVQRRSDGPVVVPTRVTGVARKSRIEIAVEDDDDLAPLMGLHRGYAIDGLSLRRNPARQPRGLFSTFRVAHSPEPGVVGMRNTSHADLK